MPPATGDLLEQASATMNAPDGYTHMPDMADYLDSAGEDEGIGVVGLGEDPGWTTGTLAEAASTTRRSKPFRPLPERLDDVELDGERAFHLSGAINAYSVYDEFGALRNGNFIHVEFRQSKSVPAAERQRLIESALASFRWR
ncbi:MULTISPECIES: hypothetical protein [unclassified Nocardioides]|uniref:hypothetical protein n=1 Tax=unclassified Nocardioides TaxID=2615069 RepID=UPI0036D2181B